MASDGKEKNKKQCFICACKLDADHHGIHCAGGCAICPDCSRTFVNMILAEPQENIPLQCSYVTGVDANGKNIKCGHKIIVNTFERQLNIEQAQMFVMYNLQFNPSACLAEDEHIVECPFCKYYEINVISEGRMYFDCKHKDCGQVSCFWCKSRIASTARRQRGGGYAEDEQKNYEIDADSLEEHFECAVLSKSKKIWDDALRDGVQIPCPKCGLAGMKNDACTHMTCPGCQCEWCYVCTKALDDLDLDPASAKTIMAHNIDWERNPLRCPMWLNGVHRVDARWPTEDDNSECVTFLHRIRAMSLLKKAIAEIEENGDYKGLVRKYNIEAVCGYNIRKVRSREHVLIQRS